MLISMRRVAHRHTLTFRDGAGRIIKVRPMRNKRRQYAVQIPLLGDRSRVMICERADVKAALAEGDLTLIGREV